LPKAHGGVPIAHPSHLDDGDGTRRRAVKEEIDHLIIR
jgi:hypothetical protein